MKCFDKNYSLVYDYLYDKKNYTKEFNLIKKIIKKYLSKPTSLLDLGCGTGVYSNLMTKLKLHVVGVDRSSEMLNIAKKKFKKNKKLSFIKSDLVKMKLKKKFDIISALFHILSYHTSNKKIDQFFSVTNKHLKKNGILIFDFWYEDGVYKLQSPFKVREFENKTFKLVRITISKWFKNIDQIFDIHKLTVLNKKSKKILEFKEIHKMRYFKLNTIKKKLKQNNFEFLKSLDLQNGKPVSEKSWGALIVAKKM